MSAFDDNIYYNPEAFGYELVKDIELRDEPWEFDLLVIWRDNNGNLVWGTDMGCSCPVPFEDHKPEELEPYDYKTVKQYIRNNYSYEHRQLTLEEHIGWLRRNLTDA